MSGWLNQFGQSWLHYFGVMTIQNTIFLAGILLLLYLLRDKNPRFLRLIALIGLLKLFIPPILFPQAGTALTTNLTLPTILVTPGESIAVTAGSAELSIAAILLMLWLTGLCGFLLFSGAKILGLRYTRQYSREIPWPGRFEHCEEILLSKSSKVNTPLIAGLFSKQILVPNYWTDLSHGSKQSIIHHELAHLEQKDHWVTVLQIIGTIINFFNPLVWILNNKINTLSELTCDERALDRSRLHPANYVKSLVEVAEISTLSRLMTMAPAFSESYHNLKSRIDYHLEKGSEMRSRIRLKHVLALVVIGLFIIPLSCNLNQESSDSITVPSNSSDSESVTSEPSQGPFTAYDVAPNPEELPPPKPPENGDIKFVPYDQPPMLIGGYAALQQAIEYPEMAREAGIEGTVIVRAFINDQGEVEQTIVDRGVPKSGLDEAAVAAVRKTKWEPALQRDNAVGVWYSIPIRFQITPQ